MENSSQNQYIIPPSSPEPVMTETSSNMKLWKKILLGLALIILIAGAGLYFLPSILTLVFPGDDTLVDSSQLRLEKVSVPDIDNGFYDLNKITKEMIHIPVNDQKIPFDTEYTDSTKPVKWDQQMVDQVLNQNQQVLSLFDAAAGKNYIQVPQYADPVNISIDTEIPMMNNWRSAAKLQAINALSLSFQGKADQALVEAAKLNIVGHKIIEGNNSLIGTLVGIAIQQLGSQTILRILPYNNPSTQALETTRVSIKDNSDNLEGYRNAFRFEYLNAISAIDMVDSEVEAEIQQAVESGEISPQYAKYAKYGYYYKPNQTKNLYTDVYNQQVAGIGAKCDLDDLDQEMSLENNQVVSWKLPFTENLIGKLLFSVTGVPLGSVITKLCQNDLITNVVQTELALRQYKLDKGVLPNTLSELTPQYLSTIPIDPFDHQPLRYSVSKKILYSVGLKNQDLGGSEGDDWMKMENPTFSIGF